MTVFFIGLILLAAGYFLYSKFIESRFGISDAETPAYRLRDDVDYKPLPTWKVYIIQLLNIAGLGPIFGALLGAVYGPVAFVWVIGGCIFGGAVHDYISGMISLRHDGASLSELYGEYLGTKVQSVMRVITIFFLIIVGIVFITGPAALLNKLFPVVPTLFWTLLIIVYYFLATVMPIDTIIGKLYPIFGAALFLMAILIGGGLVVEGYTLPKFTIANLNPTHAHIFPMLFVTIACGAISGFHATQSPLMARCLKKEKYGRPAFFGAMISEGVIALVWVAAGLAFYKGTPALAKVVLSKVGPSGAIFDIANHMLGPVGTILVVLGVVACPITTGDTALRNARLTIAEILKYPQTKIKNRLVIAVPMYIICTFLTFVNFPVLFRYMNFLTQAFAMVTLWACSVYMYKKSKNFIITLLPGIFMTTVSVSYILQAKEGLRLPAVPSNAAGIIVALFCTILFFVKMNAFKAASQKAAVE